MSVRVHTTQWKPGSGPAARNPQPPTWCPSPTTVALAVVAGCLLPILLATVLVVGWFQ